MKIKHLFFAASLIVCATVAFAEGSREIPVNRGANETAVSFGYSAESNSQFYPRWFTAGVRVSGGFFSFTGKEADYVGW